jgi:hypothetical protein
MWYRVGTAWVCREEVEQYVDLGLAIQALDDKLQEQVLVLA